MMLTPIRPRVTRPVRSWGSRSRTVLMGTANPMPRLLGRSLTIAVLMPMTSPRRFSRGPPELPGLMAASVWMTRWGLPGTWRNGLPTALTTPTVTVCPRSKGLPMAITQSPGRIWSESPNVATGSGKSGRSVSSRRALSVRRSRPTTSAS